jgi:hypothetical protein
MVKKLASLLALIIWVSFSANSGRAQSFNATISGAVSDPTGATIPNATVTLRAVATGTVLKTTTGPDGLYRFPNLQQGAYELSVAAAGFRDYVQRGIAVNINESVRVDVNLLLGTSVQTLEVAANASPLNYETPELKQAITTENIENLPLLISGSIRSAAQFVVLMPGVTTGAGNNGYDARINGGQQSSDEAVLDGISLQDSMNSQSGMTEALVDHPLSPEMLGEISVLTSNYEPQYGSSAAGQITATMRSGTNQFHGDVYEFLRNTDLNARFFGAVNMTDANGNEIPGTARPKDQENDFGGTIGGPVKIPGLAWTGTRKTYFFAGYEVFRRLGATVSPTLSIPSLLERQGDFSDWKDSSGNLIPIYDPDTTRPNLNYNSSLPVGPNNLPYLRDQFMGCDGKTPNVICPTDPRLQNSLAKAWFKYLPTPTFSGPLNNYIVPIAVPQTVFGDQSLLDVRVDHYWRDKDHFAVTVHYHGSSQPRISELPVQIANEQPYWVNYGFLDRFNWDHTLTPTVLNNFNLGYNSQFLNVSCIDRRYASAFPQIAGLSDYSFPPVINLGGGFSTLGCTANPGGAYENRPTAILNDMATWMHGKHTVKFGGEFRWAGFNNTNYGYMGTFNFVNLETGLIGINSGNAVASFLLGQVDSASDTFATVGSQYPRQKAWNLHAGDTWRLTPKLTVNYGVRWDVALPAEEKHDNLTFFDPKGVNPEAGGLLGTLAFAGTKWGSASFGSRHPEESWFGGVAPRLGFAYSLSEKTVVRAGYGIFYQNAYYPGWNGGISQDGFNATPAFSSSLGGLQAAFLLSQGFPQDFAHPPFINPGADNGGSSINYRPFEANRLPYAQQWSLTVEHQFTPNFYASGSYVGNKGTRLLSNTAPLNALNPQLLSKGESLFDQFQPGQASLDGVPVPYADWVSQMQCAPTVAQALLPYPQYCSELLGQNENAGNSTYHALQLKVEHRMSHGLWLLASYTNSKTLTDSDSIQTESELWSGGQGVISPFERKRNKALSTDDVPQIITTSLVYDLPVGKGHRWLDRGGVADKALGGWQLSTIVRFSSGTPLFFRSGNCNVPSQFDAGCLPGILAGANPFAQSESNFDPGKGPLLNAAAFENSGPEGFQFNFGQGSRISNLRGFGFHNQDISLLKNIHITERVGFQLRGEFFNIWNWHVFACQTQCLGALAFGNDIASPAFGAWNGAVSAPRNIQLGAKILF